MKTIGWILLFTFAISSCKKNQETPIRGGITKTSTQVQDRETLSKLRAEIAMLSESTPCTDASEWEFAAIGAKACGGPSGYVAYSSKINETDFLAKVSFYTVSEREYNLKWGVMSNCMAVDEPQKVACDKGKAVVVY